jgi:hypothetical protein
MKIDPYKLVTFVTIGFALLLLWIGMYSILQSSFKELNDFQQTTGELTRTAIINSMSIDQDFDYDGSDYLGLMIKSDSSKYALYHLNLDLKKIQDSLKVGGTLTVYFQSDQYPKNVKQLVQNGIMIANFEDSRNYLTWSYIRIIFISMIFLLFGRWLLRRKTGHNNK